MDNYTHNQAKSIHPLFVLLNFLFSPDSISFELTDLEKLVLIAIVKHGGPEGMFVTQKTLAIVLNVEVKSIENIVFRLKKKKVFTTRKEGRKNHYDFLIPPYGGGYNTPSQEGVLKSIPPPTGVNTPSYRGNTQYIDHLRSAKSFYNNGRSKNEQKSSVPFWGPGHPGYDSLNNPDKKQ